MTSGSGRRGLGKSLTQLLDEVAPVIAPFGGDTRAVRQQLGLAVASKMMEGWEAQAPMLIRLTSGRPYFSHEPRCRKRYCFLESFLGASPPGPRRRGRVGLERQCLMTIFPKTLMWKCILSLSP